MNAAAMKRQRPLNSVPRAVSACLLLSCFVLEPPSAHAQATIEVSETLITVIQQVRVPALRAGQITELNVAEGDLVEAGQVLAQIDDRAPRLAMLKAKSEYETALKAAESELAVRLAMKKYELAKSDLRRAQEARSRLAGSIPDEDYENRKLQVERTDLEVKKTEEDRANALAQARLYENDYRSAELDMKQTQVVSPIAGVVVSIERHKGEWAKAGDTVLELLRTTRLRAEAMIDISDITQPLVGKRVTVKVKMPDGSFEKFEGVVRFESPEISPLDNRVSVWAEIENPQRRLRPGMRGPMTIDLSGPMSDNRQPESFEQTTARRAATEASESK